MKTKLWVVIGLILVSAGFRSGTRTISGYVRDASTNNPLSGVSISLKGTATSTSTDAFGWYKISVPEQGGILVFSFPGYSGK